MPIRSWRPLALGLAAALVCAVPAAPQDASLERRIEECGGCHGADGNSPTEGIPSIAGQPEMFLVNQLILIREGVRPVEVMKPFVEGLTDAEIVAIAEHFSGLAATASDEPVDPALVERGAALAERRRCGSCHGADLAGQDQIPRIAKQRVEYLFHALKEFRDGTRRGADTLMSLAVAGLSNADLEALAHYAASR
ncbi:MAG TPA: c-type cytochrome [Afifellaceae bacterium]|nr:c-type cytochrome [Afifellaceae bacterium]